jgi:hypothetical protein
MKALSLAVLVLALAACSSTGDVPAQRPTSDFNNANHLDCMRIAQNINHGVNDAQVRGACADNQPDKSGTQ